MVGLVFIVPFEYLKIQHHLSFIYQDYSIYSFHHLIISVLCTTTELILVNHIRRFKIFVMNSIGLAILCSPLIWFLSPLLVKLRFRLTLAITLYSQGIPLWILHVTLIILLSYKVEFLPPHLDLLYLPDIFPTYVFIGYFLTKVKDEKLTLLISLLDMIGHVFIISLDD